MLVSLADGFVHRTMLYDDQTSVCESFVHTEKREKQCYPWVSRNLANDLPYTQPKKRNFEKNKGKLFGISKFFFPHGRCFFGVSVRQLSFQVPEYPTGTIVMNKYL